MTISSLTNHVLRHNVVHYKPLRHVLTTKSNEAKVMLILRRLCPAQLKLSNTSPKKHPRMAGDPCCPPGSTFFRLHFCMFHALEANTVQLFHFQSWITFRLEITLRGGGKKAKFLVSCFTFLCLTMKVSHFCLLAFVGETIVWLMEPERATVCAVQ